MHEVAGAVRRLLGDAADIEGRLPGGWFSPEMLRVGVVGASSIAHGLLWAQYVCVCFGCWACVSIVFCGVYVWCALLT